MPKVDTKRILFFDGKPECYKFRTLPKLLVEALGWKEGDVIEFDYNQEGQLLLTNKNRKSNQGLTLALELARKQWLLNKKKYSKELAENLTPDARQVLHSTNWEEVRDGSYYKLIETYHGIQALNESANSYPHSLKESLMMVIDAHKNYARALQKHLDDNGGPKPDNYKALEKKITKIIQ